MDRWPDVYASLRAARDQLGTTTPWFRGHARAEWDLLPTLSRCRPTGQARQRFTTEEDRETTVYERFAIEAGPLLPAEDDGWSVVFAMQHHGLPTRLLDWTSSFAVALLFAMREATERAPAAVWMLNPFRLNEALRGDGGLRGVRDFPASYREMFIDRTTGAEASVEAFDPPRQHPRVFQQRGGFTLHADLRTPLQTLAPAKALVRIDIPPDAHEGARAFLALAGTSEFQIFPDLDGLARDLKTRYY